MSWSLDIIDGWVETALRNIGYSETLAKDGAFAVTWLQQRNAPGVAAMAQHIDFLSAYKLTPKQDGDESGQCPIRVGRRFKHDGINAPQSVHKLRQPLLLIPFISDSPGVLSWDGYELPFSDDEFSIEYERKTLRAILVAEADVTWQKLSPAPNNRQASHLTEVPSRDLAYVKTLQHYAGTLERPEPSDGDDPTNNTSSSP